MTRPHHAPGGRFRNPWPDGRIPGLSGVLRWGLQRLVTRLPPDPDASAFPRVAHTFAERAGSDELVITWVGHATFLVQIGGQNVLTDPVWAARASPVSFAGPRRHVAPGVGLGQLPPIDVVLLSHNHYDHLDAAAVRRLARAHPAARWIVPLGLDRFVARRGVARVTALDWWEETRHGGLAIGCTPAQHFSARGPGDRDRTLWCGWSLAAPARRLYFAGDSGYFPEFGAIGDRFGPFHAALLPVGAYEPRWFMRRAHMNPEDAVRAFGELHAGRPLLPGGRGVMVAMHWGTFKLTDEPLDEPPRRLRQAWAAAGRPDADCWVLAHGETRRL